MHLKNRDGMLKTIFQKVQSIKLTCFMTTVVEVVLDEFLTKLKQHKTLTNKTMIKSRIIIILFTRDNEQMNLLIHYCGGTGLTFMEFTITIFL